MTTWYVGSQHPGTSTFLDLGLVAVNFVIRAPAGGLDVEELKAVAVGKHEEWDRKVPGVRTNFARQLEAFASRMVEGDDVVTFDSADRDRVYLGKVRSGYRYEDPPSVEGHPHVRDVDWVSETAREDLPDGGKSIEFVRGITVKELWGAPTHGTRPIDDAPEPTVVSAAVAESARLTPDTFTWEPASGLHRYVLRQSFQGQSFERSILVVMLNPGANHLPGFRRSSTCHAVRRWGEANGFDSAIYVNLFTVVEPNSSMLHKRPLRDLNGPDADEVIRRVSQEVDGPAIAGWGNLPPGVDRAGYDKRVREVERLVDRPLMTLGFNQTGYPKHGRRWRPSDQPLPLRGV